MIRILFEDLGIVMTLDSQEEIDSVIEAVQNGRLKGFLRGLDQREPKAIIKSLKTVKAFKETEGQSYPALASWFDDKVDPKYHDELTDQILEMAKRLHKENNETTR